MVVAGCVLCNQPELSLWVKFGLTLHAVGTKTGTLFTTVPNTHKLHFEFPSGLLLGPSVSCFFASAIVTSSGSCLPMELLSSAQCFDLVDGKPKFIYTKVVFRQDGVVFGAKSPLRKVGQDLR